MSDLFERNQARFDAIFSDPSHAIKLRAKGLLTFTRQEGQWLTNRIARLTGFTVPTQASVLEIGAGNGYVSTNLALAHPNILVTVLDLSAEAVKASRRHGTVQGVQANALSLPFHDQRFDLVIGRAILHHLPDIALVFQEILRVLKPNGCALFFGEPAVPGADRYRTFKRWYGKWFRKASQPSLLPETARHARADYPLDSGWQVELVNTGLFSSYLSFLWYPFLLKLKVGRLCDVCHSLTKWLTQVNDRIVPVLAPHWACEQWVVVKRSFNNGTTS